MENNIWNAAEWIGDTMCDDVTADTTDEELEHIEYTYLEQAADDGVEIDGSILQVITDYRDDRRREKYDDLGKPRPLTHGEQEAFLSKIAGLRTPVQASVIAATTKAAKLKLRQEKIAAEIAQLQEEMAAATAEIEQVEGNLPGLKARRDHALKPIAELYEYALANRDKMRTTQKGNFALDKAPEDCTAGRTSIVCSEKGIEY